MTPLRSNKCCYYGHHQRLLLVSPIRRDSPPGQAQVGSFPALVSGVSP